MIKIDIVKRVAQHLSLKDQEALQIVDAIIDSIKETICDSQRLEVRDFGVFQTKVRKARTGRNPRNRKEYPIPERRVVTFKLGKELKDFSIVAEPASDAGSVPSPAAESGASTSFNQDTFLSEEQK